jgi:predicted RNase H-like HicB family nuclease
VHGKRERFLNAGRGKMDSLNIKFTIHVWQEGSQFIAHAMPLDVLSAGNTPDEAKKALDEAVRLFLRTASDMGTLQEILEECGYQCDKGTCVSPEWIAIERHTSMIGLS